VSRAHLFADGGGRELAYVAMSRARGFTHAFVVADDLAQGAEDLKREWSSQRTSTWAIDTGLPDQKSLTGTTVARTTEEERFRLAALVLAERMMTANAIASIRPADLAPALAEARATLRQAEHARADLKRGWGIYQHTEAGRAVADLAEAKRELLSARTEAEYGARRRDRRAGAKKEAKWAAREKDVEERWQKYVAPEIARFDAEIARHQGTVDQLIVRREAQAAASRLAIERRWALQCDAHHLAVGLDSHRDQLDGIPRPARRRSQGQSRKLRDTHSTPQLEPIDRPRLGM
jgi:hypothetical protein